MHSSLYIHQKYKWVHSACICILYILLFDKIKEWEYYKKWQVMGSTLESWLLYPMSHYENKGLLNTVAQISIVHHLLVYIISSYTHFKINFLIYLRLPRNSRNFHHFIYVIGFIDAWNSWLQTQSFGNIISIPKTQFKDVTLSTWQIIWKFCLPVPRMFFKPHE